MLEIIWTPIRSFSLGN